MALIPYDPFKELDSFFDEDDWFFPVRSSQKAVPEMDVYETENSVVAEVSTPGMDPEDLSVKVEDSLLKISGQTEEESEESEEERGYYRKEIKRGAFERAVRLPSNIDTDNIQAKHKQGILKIEIPKTERQIEEGSEIEIESE